MLRLDNTCLSLGQRRWTFDLSLDTHGVYALVGRSGSGKSTLLNLIGGFLQPDTGDIKWKDESLLMLQPDQRPVTTLFQQHNLFDHLSVWKNVAIGISPSLSIDTVQKEHIASALNDVGLAGHEHKMPGQLSGGEQQRVALARCMLRRKPLLLLDEPFSALDATTRHEMISLLRRLIEQHEPCVLMITHDENDAQALGASLLDMHNDRVAFR